MHCESSRETEMWCVAVNLKGHLACVNINLACKCFEECAFLRENVLSSLSSYLALKAWNVDFKIGDSIVKRSRQTVQYME